MQIGNKDFFENKTYVMGILNVSPDSFSDGGKYTQKEIALKHAMDMVEQGASIIDIGGESTRPDYTPISEQEEIERVCPIIELIKKEIDIPVSLDTYKSKVAQVGISTGIDFINDIWGLKKDKDMAEIIAKAELPCCLMHNRATAEYIDFTKDLLIDMQESIQIALQAGINPLKIVLDPGVGFAKSYQQNLLAIKHLDQLKSLGFPVLLGTSKKSVIGLTLDLPKQERNEGTIATTVMAVMAGAMFVRVHDVKENIRAIKMTEAVLYSGE